jgi:hypothetical protein
VRHRPPRDLRHGAKAAALLLACGALAFAGCGSDDSGSSSDAATTGTGATPSTVVGPSTVAAPSTAAPDDQALIRAAITGAFTSPQVDLACGQYVTPAYVAAAFGDDEGCAAAVRAGAQARAVSVTSLSLDGGSATASVIPHGGPSSGQTVEVTLLKEDGAWAVDKAKSNVPVGP